ncbi:histidine utilization repressor [Pseudomaricurvus alkylphenolicus]|nr:histidine utilization repressor [Pseudomaricurvus alkylphenolicus]
MQEAIPVPKHTTNTPLYQTVKDHILEIIRSGDWPSDKRLPSESELVDELSVSRMTVNRALRELTSEGFITRLAGVGSFITEKGANKIQSHPLEIQNIATDVLARGHSYSCEVTTLTEVRAGAEIAMAFSIAPGSRLFYSEITHFESGMPIQVENRHVLPAFAPEYLETDFTQVTTNEYLMSLKGPIEEIEQIVQACMPAPELRKSLQMTAKEPCLLLVRRTWVKGAVVTATKLYHPSSRYQFGSRYNP